MRIARTQSGPARCPRALFIRADALLVSCSLIVGGEAAGQCTPVWSALEPPPFGTTLTATTYDEDGSGPGKPALFVGGHILSVGGITVNKIARWDGWSWSALGAGVGPGGADVKAILGAMVIGEETVGGLFAGGSFQTAGGVAASNTARWKSGLWFELGGGTGPVSVRGLGVFDEDGPGPGGTDLLVGGTVVVGGVPVDGVSRWNALTWSALGGGLRPFVSGQWQSSDAFAVYDDDGPGPIQPALYVGGDFRYAGQVEAWNIARWDGQNWSSLDLGATALVESMCVYDDDGPGPNPPMLYVGGDFPDVGNRNNWLLVNGLARWDGREWSAVPGWEGATAQAMVVFDDDGPGPNPPALFVGGGFSWVAGQPARHIAKWDGQSWTTMATGLSGMGAGTNVRALAVFDEDGDGPNPGGLYVGGYFTHAGGVPAPGLARWGCPLPQRCYADCDRSGALDIFDFLCFQNSFVLGEPYACDCDPDPVCDIFDFLCFQSAFVAGCP